MDDVLNQLLQQLGPQAISAISNQIGTDEDKTVNALGGIVPTLLGAMANNSQSEQGASGLLGALDKDHDGSILDDALGFIGNFTNGPGEGILKHVLGGNQPVVENGLSQKTGLNASQIGSLLKIAAPLVMAYLGRQKKEGSSGFDISNIASILGGMTQQADKSTGLDLGDILSVVGSLTGNQTQSQGGGTGGMLGLLGKLFRK
jgi:hypothetical protein